MKFKFTLILLFLFTLVNGQSKNKYKNVKSALKQVAETTTIFVLSEDHSIKEYESALKDVWTVSPFKVVLANNYSIVDYADKKYSIIRLAKFVKYAAPGDSSPSYSKSYYYYELLCFRKNKTFKKNIEYNINKKQIIQIGWFKVYGNIIASMSDTKSNKFSKKNAKNYWGHLYNSKYYKNFELFQLIMNFKELNLYAKNRCRKESGKANTLKNKNSKQKVRSLLTDTLYIPDNIPILKHKKYRYPFKVIPIEELNTRVLSGENLKYLRVGGGGIVPYQTNIIDTETGMSILSIDYILSNNYYSNVLTKLTNKVKRKTK